MLDENLGAQATTDFIVRVTNNSAIPVPNFTIFVNRITPPTDPSINLFPASVQIVQLDPGETEECHFLVHNGTTDVQEDFTFRVRSSYFGIADPAIGGATHEYDNFVRP
jgi:hypothetical protein